MNEISLNDYLCHYNVPGSKWYQHKTGKWQSHAQYAMGKANPDARDNKSNSVADKLGKKLRSAFSEERMNTIKDSFKKAVDDVADKRRAEYEKHLAEEAKKKQAVEARKERMSAVESFFKTGKFSDKSISSSRSPNTLSSNPREMSDEDLRKAIARLRSENEYYREFENRSNLEAKYREMTAPESEKRLRAFLGKAKNTAKTVVKSDAGKVAGNLAMISFKKVMAEQYGNDFANSLFAGTRIDKGKKKGGGGENGDQQGQQNENQQQGGGKNKRGNKNGNRNK